MAVLERSLQKGRLGHSILLYGEHLAALEKVALALAQLLLKSGEEPAKHPDCFTLRPSNKMRGIGAEATRELIRCIQLTPHSGDTKVALLYEADRMNRTAANVFLKTLEEPPPDTTLILLTTRPYALLDTIRSRTFHFRIPETVEPVHNLAWQSWLERYKAWLNSLKTPLKKREERTQVILMAYSLTNHFEAVLNELGETTWENEQAQLPEGLPDEQKIALEAGIRKGLLRQLLTEIAESSRTHALDLVRAGQPMPIQGYLCVIDTLHHLIGLLEVNLNPATALEAFLLQSLSLWRA